MKTPGVESLAEFEWPGLPERNSLRRALRHRLRLDVPNLRVIAEDFLTEASPIDLLAVGSSGELVSIRLGEEDEDPRLLTSLLADLQWLSRHAGDLLKLNAELAFEPSAPPRAMLLCPTFAKETRAAVEMLPDGIVELYRYRCLRQQGQLSLMIEACKLDGSTPSTRPEAGQRPSGPNQTAPLFVAHRPSAPAGPSTFRTALTDADLQFEPEETPL
jgi:hypothetical protein